MTSASSLRREERRTGRTLGRHGAADGRPDGSVDPTPACGRRAAPRGRLGAGCRPCPLRPPLSLAGPRPSCQNGATTTPTAPGPTWAPIAAPSSLTCSSRSRAGARAARRRAARRARRRPGGAPRRTPAPRPRPPPRAAPAGCTRAAGAHLLQRDDPAVLDVQDGLHSEAEPRMAAAAPIRPPRRRYSRVSTTKKVGCLGGGPGDLGDLVASAPAAAARAAQHRGAAAHGGGPGVDDGHDVLADLGGGQPGGVRGAGQLGGEVHRHQPVGSRVERPPVGGDEVPGVGREVDTVWPRTDRARATSSGPMSTPSRPERRAGRRRGGRRGCRSPRESQGR